ncbi:unnamed protein product [Pedinophyceae sp. YPF-701]|nr:unnamed protein product [Pedinophyceae sp. YPF-701]
MTHCAAGHAARLHPDIRRSASQRAKPAPVRHGAGGRRCGFAACPVRRIGARDARATLACSAIAEDQSASSPADEALLNFIGDARLDDEPRTELLIRPMTEPWVGPMTSLLCDAFMDSLAILPAYQRYLRRQITGYLKDHMKMVPKALILVALVVETHAVGSDGSEDPHMTWTEQPDKSRLADDDDGAILLTPGGSDPALQVPANAGVRSGAAAANPDPLATFLPTAFTPAYRNRQAAAGGAPALPVDTHDGRAFPLGESPPSAAAGLRRWRLVGTTEVSFHVDTRTKYVTLNPPDRCAYLCNMAVHPSWRRKGIGAALLRAAEDLAREAGEEEMYLHLRLKDGPAEALYRTEGYEVQSTDNILVPIIGMDRRHLMVKRLTEP